MQRRLPCLTISRRRSTPGPRTLHASPASATRERPAMERGHYVETQNTAYFRHVYDGEHADMRRLYEQAKLDQWNAATDIDWGQPLDSDGGLIADDLVDIHGSPFWERLSPAQPIELNRRAPARPPSDPRDVRHRGTAGGPP